MSFLWIKVHSVKIWSDYCQNIEDIGLWSSPNREPHRSSSLMVCIRGWQPCSSQHQQWKWPSWGLSTPPCCSTDHVSSDQEIYIQVTNPSALIISSAVQNQSECYNDCDMVCMWQLCPKTHSVVLNLWRRQLLLPPHDAMNWLLLSRSSTSWRRLTWKLVPSWPGSWSAVVHIRWWAKGLQCSEKWSKVKEEDKKGSQDKELAAEGVQYEAEERWTAGLTLTHDFHLHYSSSIVLLYPKLYHFFY